MKIFGNLKSFIILNTISTSQENHPSHESGVIPSLLNLPMGGPRHTPPTYPLSTLSLGWHYQIRGHKPKHVIHPIFSTNPNSLDFFFRKKNRGWGCFFKVVPTPQKFFPEKSPFFEKSPYICTIKTAISIVWINMQE